ncbi:MAG: V4R domain-containing protein [Bacteroidales bacterium]|jgi:hypothetical protein
MKSETERGYYMEDYNFTWDQLGDVKDGRPNLSMNTRVEVYRLMQFTMRAVLEKEYGNEITKEILIKSGKLAGTEFCKNMLDSSLPLTKFIAQLTEKLLEFSIGILKVEKLNPDTLSFVVTVSEDLDCSGLPVTGYTVCDYDEGFLEGIFNTYTGKNYVVKEVDCWCTGERTCRFAIDVKTS